MIGLFIIVMIICFILGIRHGLKQDAEYHKKNAEKIKKTAAAAAVGVIAATVDIIKDAE
jgi:hypothetical protein